MMAVLAGSAFSASSAPTTGPPTGCTDRRGRVLNGRGPVARYAAMRAQARPSSFAV